MVSEEIFTAMPGLVAGEPVRPTTIVGTSSGLMPTYLVLLEIPNLGIFPLRVTSGKVDRILLGKDVLSQALFILNGTQCCWSLSRASLFGWFRSLVFHFWPRRKVKKPIGRPKANDQ